MENMKLMFVFRGCKKGSITMQITSSPRDTENKKTRLVQKQTCMREEKYTG